MILIIGLTGGIGSGKTTVAKMFNKLGVPVYYADFEAKKLMQNSKIIKRKLIKKFGEQVYFNNKLNRQYLAKLVFKNKENLKYLESVVHPKVHQHFKRWIKNQKSPYILQENAILFENRSDKFCDYVITVTAPISIKMDRVIARDNTSKAEVKLRMNNQWSDNDKIKKSDFIIENTNLELTNIEVVKIHKKIMNIVHNKEVS